MTIAKIKFSQLPSAEDTIIEDDDIIPVVNLASSKTITFGEFKQYLTGAGFADVAQIDSAVSDAVETIIGGAPEYLDTLEELADAINNDAGFAATVEELVNNVFVGKSTDDLPEGANNYYYTWQRAEEQFDLRLASKNTNDIVEAWPNLYFSQERVLVVVLPLIPTSVFDLDIPDTATPENIPGYLHYDGTSLSWQAVENDFSGDYNDLINKPTIPAAYTLPTASTTVLGGVKVDGTTVTISGAGVISAVGGGGGVGPNPTFTSVTATTVNAQNINFTGTGAVNITSNNDINLAAAGWITFSSLPRLPNYTIAQLNALTGVPTGAFAFCTNLTQPAPVYFDGTVWRDMINNDINGGPDDFSAPTV